MIPQQGQALIEGLVGMAVLASLTIVLSAGFLKEWRRLNCVRELFETTHARLATGQPAQGKNWCGELRLRALEELSEQEVREWLK